MVGRSGVMQRLRVAFAELVSHIGTGGTECMSGSVGGYRQMKGICSIWPAMGVALLTRDNLS